MADSQFLRVLGVSLEYEWVGPPPEQALTIVMLHEGLGCVAMWRDFAESLSAATGYGVLSYSRQGYGQSDSCELPRPLSYMHDEAENVLPELIKVAGLRDYVLLGHSDGGSIALIHAGMYQLPGLKGVICESPHVFCEDLSVSSIQAAKEAFENDNLRERLKKYHGANTDCAFWGWNAAWLDADFISWNIEEYLSKIHVPVLVVQGVDDQYGTAAQVKAIAAQSGSRVEVAMLENCGHSPHREQQSKSIEVMQHFLLEVVD